ncbi:UNVERIFIED_CONTAM: hypothetical protein Slati_2921900 [Sesamum latifolium]|uniref:Retrotransposon gag domain-containing protein n=1 Tax=Sesamum latifolium TaxID=2727402 RepID=A0AAW2VGN1_9LAMI
MNLPTGSIESFEWLIQKFAFHFACKRKAKRSATHLFTIRQKEEESLKSFMGRFNNETLEVQDLRIDMMVNILIHGLKKGSFASALARDPPGDVKQLMSIAQKYIDEEEMNAIKDDEWFRGRDRDRRRDRPKDRRFRSEKDRDAMVPYQLKYHKYTPLSTTRSRSGWFAKGFLGNSFWRRGRKSETETERKKGVDQEAKSGLEVVRERKNGLARTRPQKELYTPSQEDPQGETQQELGKSTLKASYTKEIRYSMWGTKRISSSEERICTQGRARKTILCSMDIIFASVLRKMDLRNLPLKLVKTPLVGFGGSEVIPEGTIDLPVSMGDEPTRRTCMIQFLVVDSPFAYNVVLGRLGLNTFQAVVSTYHLKMKFPTKGGIGEVRCDQ